ncbi:hypothetical protein RF11_08498 [Thelohanellus kitauei]|uniref:Uncharacterized protein n=1 Tax=Thelohanellus kitauei TaxID=669202 RepID=A0A0C2N6P2_THEKT|nr:hypothetical protein RF11_08498 [Thelohanellus kitauei]
MGVVSENNISEECETIRKQLSCYIEYRPKECTGTLYSKNLLNSTNNIDHNFLIESSITCVGNNSTYQCEKQCMITLLSIKTGKTTKITEFVIRYQPTSKSVWGSGFLKLVNLILTTVLVIYLLFAFSRTSPEPSRKRAYYDTGNIYDDLSNTREAFTLNGVIPVPTSSFLSTDTQINPINKDKKDDYYGEAFVS